MRVRIWLFIVAVLALGGCSDENLEARGEFLSGCVRGGATKKFCSCTFEKLEKKYSPAELRRLNAPMINPPESFLKDAMSSAAACQSHQ